MTNPSSPPMVEAVARALYAERPFVMASTATTQGHQLAQSFDWDGAPAYYQEDMRQLARAALASLPHEGDAAKLKVLEEENADLKSSVIAFAGPHAELWARDHELPKGHLHPQHYDLLAKCGARMDDFTRAALAQSGDRHG